MITDQTSKAGPYTADGSQQAFPFYFRVLDASHVDVYLNDRRVAEDYYSISLSSNGGTVTFREGSTPAAGETIAIIRNVPPTQEVDLQNHTAFLPEVLEDAFDKLTMLIQQLKEVTTRTLTIPPTAEVDQDALFADFKRLVDNVETWVNAASNSATSAAGSATSASNSATSAAGSATTARNAEDAARSLAAGALGYANSAASSAESAAGSATSASNSVDQIRRTVNNLSLNYASFQAAIESSGEYTNYIEAETGQTFSTSSGIRIEALLHDIRNNTLTSAWGGVYGSDSGSTVTFNSVVNNTVTFPGIATLPFAVVTDKGSVYFIEKGSLTINPVNGTFTLDVTPYLAYDNSASFSGTWTLYLGGASEDFGLRMVSALVSAVGDRIDLTFKQPAVLYAVTPSGKVIIPSGTQDYEFVIRVWY